MGSGLPKVSLPTLMTLGISNPITINLSNIYTKFYRPLYVTDSMPKVSFDQFQSNSEMLKPGNLTLGKMKLGQSTDQFFHNKSSDSTQIFQIQPKPTRREIYDL